MKKRLAIFLKGYPRISETFIAQEIALLEKAGLDLQLISLRYPTDKKRHKIHKEIKAPILYLPEYIHYELPRCFRAWRNIRKTKNYKQAKAAWLKDLKRDFTPNRIRRFFQALVVANEIDKTANWFFYAHFIHTPASVAGYAAMLCQTSLAISAHAKDIWTSPQWELAQKIKQAKWIVSCTKGGVAYLQCLTREKQKIKLLYHGLDLARFSTSQKKNNNDGSKANMPLHFLSIGRMVEKKGFDSLLVALAKLDNSLHWRWTHIGSGPLKMKLLKQADELHIKNKVQFHGTQSQTEILQAYRKADLFILSSRITKQGDRDGLPNVIVEAQSQALAVISTNISGIPELIENNINGILVKPDSPAELAKAITTLSQNPSKRIAMGLAGEKKVKDNFNCENEIKQLLDLLAKW